MSAVTPVDPTTDYRIRDRIGQMPEQEPSGRSEVGRFAHENSSIAIEPDYEIIALLAYGFWEDRLKNNTAGSPEDDWYRAEHVLSEASGDRRNVFP